LFFNELYLEVNEKIPPLKAGRPRTTLPDAGLFKHGTTIAGEWRVTRTGSTAQPLQVNYTIGGDAVSGVDFKALAGGVTIPAGQQSATISVSPIAGASDNRTVVISLVTGQPEYHVGCPSQSLIVIRK